MLYIYDEEGNIISQSQNLAGIRRFAGKNIVNTVGIIKRGTKGELQILFQDGSFFNCVFESYSVLLDTLRRWRNLYGAKLVVNGTDGGEIDYYNPNLISTSWT